MDEFRQVSVEEELQRNPELRKEDIKEILEWIDTCPDLPKITGVLFDFIVTINISV